MQQEVKLYPSKQKWTLVLIASLIFTVTGIAMFITETSKFMPILTIAFFGLCLVVSVIALIPGSSYLKLTAAGFEQKTMYRTFKNQWVEIDHFEPIAVRVNNYASPFANRSKFAGIKYNTEQKLSPMGEMAESFNQSKYHVDGGLSDNYGMSVEDLCAYLNKYVAAYGNKAQANPSPEPENGINLQTTNK